MSLLVCLQEARHSWYAYKIVNQPDNKNEGRLKCFLPKKTMSLWCDPWEKKFDTNLRALLNFSNLRVPVKFYALIIINN